MKIMENYKGMYYHEAMKVQYYEGGAHFKYKDLYKLLQKYVSVKDKNKLKNNNKDEEVDKFNVGRSLSYNHNKQSRNKRVIEEHYSQYDNEENIKEKTIEDNNYKKIDNKNKPKNDVVDGKYQQKCLFKKLLRCHKQKRNWKNIIEFELTNNSILNKINLSVSNHNTNLNLTQQTKIKQKMNNDNRKYIRNNKKINLVKAFKQNKNILHSSNNANSNEKRINSINSSSLINICNNYKIKTSLQLRSPNAITTLISEEPNPNKLNYICKPRNHQKFNLLINQNFVSNKVNQTAISNNNYSILKTNVSLTLTKSNNKTYKKLKMNTIALTHKGKNLSNSNKKLNKSITFCNKKFPIKKFNDNTKKFSLSKNKNQDLNNSLGAINMTTAETTKNKNSLINNNSIIPSNNQKTLNYNGSDVSKSRNIRKLTNETLNIKTLLNTKINNLIKTAIIHEPCQTNQNIYQLEQPLSKNSPKIKINNFFSTLKSNNSSVTKKKSFPQRLLKNKTLIYDKQKNTKKTICGNSFHSSTIFKSK